MNSTKEWATIKSDTDVNGATIELRYREFGKGRTKVCKWRIFRDGKQIDYAVSEADAETNWTLAMHGSTRNGRGDLI
jgi:hypothetical protein